MAQMKKQMIVVGVTTLVFLVASITSFLYVDYKMKNENTTTLSKEKKVLKKAISIDGMTCEDCEMSISAKAKSVSGVIQASASSPKGEAIVEYDASKVDIETIMKEIRKTGYRPVSSRDVGTDYTYEVEKDEDNKSEATMKCGAGKCGASVKE